MAFTQNFILKLLALFACKILEGELMHVGAINSSAADNTCISRNITPHEKREKKKKDKQND